MGAERHASQLDVASIEARAVEADRFLRMLFGVGAPSGAHVTLSWPNRDPNVPGLRFGSVHVDITKLDKLAEWAIKIDTDGVLRDGVGEQVYFGCGLRCGNLGYYRRGKTEEVIAIPGVWCDLDLAAPGHAATNLPDLAGAYEMLRALELPPTVIVHSGGGLHVWWLFADGLWILLSDDERDRASRLLTGLHVTLTALANARGWHLDPTDLSRVLRMPGCRNRKITGNPRPVRLLLADGPRHDRAALLARFEGAAPVKARRKSTSGTGHTLAADDDRPSLLVRAFELAGMLGDEMRDGRFTVICPWEAEHNTGTRFDTSTILWPPTTDSRLGSFCCLHGHCKGRRTFADVMRALGDAAKRAQAEHDAEQREEVDRWLAGAEWNSPAPIAKKTVREFCQQRMARLRAARPKRGK